MIEETCAMPNSPEELENRGMLWLIGAFVVCPCHLPITLAVLAAVLGGTAAGTLLVSHPIAAGVILTLAWGAGTWRGLALMHAARRHADRLNRSGARKRATTGGHA